MNSILSWIILAAYSSAFVCEAIAQLIFSYVVSSENHILYAVYGMALGVVHLMMLSYVYYLFRHEPHKIIGPLARAAIQVFSVFCAVILGQCKDPDTMFIIILVSGTTDLHAIAHIMHFAADIALWRDVMLIALMQIMVYVTGENLYICIPVIISCGGFIFYRYWSYSVPDFLINCSKRKGVDDC